MTGIVDWASDRARMIVAMILLSLTAGFASYLSLPKEGEPDIEIPMAIVSVPFQGISAEDSEKLLVRPMETELADLDGLKSLQAVAAEGYANIIMEFEFGWDKSGTMADIRAAMNKAEADFPNGADAYTIEEFNFSEFPIIIVNLTGEVPERLLLRVAKELQDRLEGLEPVLSAELAGHRDEMLEVVIDPLKLEAYNVTAGELIAVVQNNNQLVAAGQIDTPTGTNPVKIRSSFDEARDVYELPLKTNGDRVITLGDVAEINLTFEDRTGTARFNVENTVALQVVKRKGFNLIDTAKLVQEIVAEEQAKWPPELQDAIVVGTSNDQSMTVESMVSQLEGSVFTAVLLVMIVVLASLGTRSALLVGFAIPTSFLLCFAFLAVMGIPVSNIVMFGLILAVGMLVDGAIVVVEYAEKRIQEGAGPMHAFVEAAKRMFWPVVSSTATTLCAFLPMLLWPGVPGQFMGMLPVTLIFVLSASLLVALVYLPVMGGISGRLTRTMGQISQALRTALPWVFRAALLPVTWAAMFVGIMQTVNAHFLLPASVEAPDTVLRLAGVTLFLLATLAASIVMGATFQPRKARRVQARQRRSLFGWVIHLIVGNPVMPIVSGGLVVAFVVTTFGYFGQNNYGVEFFVETEPEQAIVYVRARGNLSLQEKDAMVRQVEQVIATQVGIDNAFAFAGQGGLNANTGGASGPRDTIGQVQIELIPWDERGEFARATPGVDLEDLDGDMVLARLEERLAKLPGIRTELFNLSRGPASGKPVHLRLKADNWQELLTATDLARAQFESTPGLLEIEDTLPLPGIDWEIDVDVEKAGRFGADVASVGAMVQMITRGIFLDTMRVDSSDEEIEIRIRLPEEYRVLSTLDSLKVRTGDGLVPLSNFITRKPMPSLSRIDRIDQQRYFDVKANVVDGLTKYVIGGGTGPLASETPETILGILRQLGEDEIEAGATGFTLAGDDQTQYEIFDLGQGVQAQDLIAQIEDGTARAVPVNPNERIALLTQWLESDASTLPASTTYEWTGDTEDQEESGQFLMVAFSGALGLMFIILLAQFNSFYNAFLVLIAVVFSTAGVLIGMLVMQQAFSIIMTGTGILALAGIVVNNNIVLIDTYQEFAKYMPRIEAITRTAQARIRPVLLTTVTTMAGLTPMMFGLSLDFFAGGYSIDSPTALWWKQLATAVVFGLGVATVLTLMFTPAMLALRVWVASGAIWLPKALVTLAARRHTQVGRDMLLNREARRMRVSDLVWDVPEIAPAAAAAAAAPAAAAPALVAEAPPLAGRSPETISQELLTAVGLLSTPPRPGDADFIGPVQPGAAAPLRAAE